MAENKDIQLRSEELHEIIGKIPNVLTRFGSLFILLVLIGIVVLSAFIKYPDIVNAPFEISNTNPPVALYAKTNGNIEQLFFNNHDTVKQGDLILVLENRALEEDVFALEANLDSFINNNYNTEININKALVLGRLQNSFALFNASYENYIHADGVHIGSSTSAYISGQIQQLRTINQGLINQQFNCQNELSVMQQNYNKDIALHQKGIISDRDLSDKANLLSQKKSACEGIAISINNNSLRIQELELQQFNVSSTDNSKVQNLKASLKENALKLKSDIDLWKNQYLIIAPEDGLISLNQIWSKNQYVENGQELLSIVLGENQMKITAQVQGKDIAKVKVDELVNLNFEAYNYLEFGYVKAKVSEINTVPRENQYTVELVLSNGEQSTYNKAIDINQGMKGTAEIICEQRTLLSRIFDKFRFLVHEKYD